MNFHQMISIEIVKINKKYYFLAYTITIMINLDDFLIILFLEMKKICKHLHTSLMARFCVLDPQFVPSNKRQDKIVKQNTFFLHSDE